MVLDVKKPLGFWANGLAKENNQYKTKSNHRIIFSHILYTYLVPQNPWMCLKNILGF